MILNIATERSSGETFTGIVYKYNVKNATGRSTLKFTAGSGDAPVVNGASVPLSIVLNAGQEGVVHSPVGKFELNTPLQNGELVAVYNSSSNIRGKFFFADKVTLSRTTEGYLLVERSVILKINNTPPQAGEALAGPRLFPTN